MRPESALQRDIRDALRWRGIQSVHVPNGAVLAGDGKQRAMQMVALKRDGLMPGFPDLILFHPVVASVGFVEVKCEGNTLTPNQVECHAWLRSLGHPVAVCRSVADLEETIHEWGWCEARPIGQVVAPIIGRLAKAVGR